jgi:predicted O-methyltransferase YrrM
MVNNIFAASIFKAKAMDFIPEDILAFSEKYTTPANDVLKALERETHQKIINPRMLAGEIQGRLISFISKMIQPKSVLEIGTFTGYSAMCWAEGLAEGGKITTVDKNEELETIIDKYISQTDLADKIEFVVGDAVEFMQNDHNTYDLIFIDADKKNYAKYFELSYERLNPKGIIVADNILWSGKVVEPEASWDRDTKALVEFCELVQNDNRFENLLLPIRDGLMVLRKLD